MAGWLDWMSQGIGNTGITWSDLTKAAMQYGSKPGSSGPKMGQLIQPAKPQGQGTSSTVGKILLGMLG